MRVHLITKLGSSDASNLLIMAGAGAGGGGNNPHQDKEGFFASSQAFTFTEEQLAAKVEEERRVLEWREGEGREAAHNTLWTQFQQTAAALTQLYRQDADRTGQGQAEAEGGGGAQQREWQPFQVAAGQLTMLYRDSLEEMRRASEAGRRAGYQRARSELVSWVRGRRGRHISRCDLLAFLARDQDPVTASVGAAAPDPVSDPATQAALLQMFESNRLGSDTRETEGGGRKRGVPGDEDAADTESEMESPQSKRSRFL